MQSNFRGNHGAGGKASKWDKQGNRENMRRRDRKEGQQLVLKTVHGSSWLTLVASDYIVGRTGGL